MVGGRTNIEWCAPGRVNVIGEHTDYNGGFALPIAIGPSCRATISIRDQPGLVIRSAQQTRQVNLDRKELIAGQVPGWPGYVAGVVWALEPIEAQLPGLLFELDSTIPIGSGLSSSAALTCSVAAGLNDLFELGLGLPELVQIAIRVENDFVGAPTGGMDQLAVLNGQQGMALFCDMRSFEVRTVRFDLASAGLSLLVVDTRASHTHAEGGYRARRAACEHAARILGVPALRDVTDLEAALSVLPNEELRGCVRHVVSENRRVLHVVDQLDAGAIADIGPSLSASHESLRVDFGVSAIELDLAVDALHDAGALGARMTGGGFGGSAIGLLATDDIPAATQRVATAFAAAGFVPPNIFTVAPSRGAHRL